MKLKDKGQTQDKKGRFQSKVGEHTYMDIVKWINESKDIEEMTEDLMKRYDVESSTATRWILRGYKIEMKMRKGLTLAEAIENS